jgi:hypothetical protein
LPPVSHPGLEYSDDPTNAVEAAFADWTVQDGDTYADIARHMLAEGGER